MRELFATILDNAWVVSIMILVIVLIRTFMKKMPKFIYPLLWGLVAVKLLLPYDIHSSFGMLPSDKTIEYSGKENAPVTVKMGLRIVDERVNNFLENTDSSSASSTKWNYYDICIYIWLAGIMILLIYMLVSYIMIHKATSQSVLIEKRTSICDEIDSPFLLGIIKPHIFLPSGIKKENYKYILAHENMHIKRGDHIWKTLGFFLLSVYWFNPFCWIAYYLFCKDVEFACDEKVISRRDSLWRANYCQTLLECSSDSRKIIFIPLGFGEIEVKERVKKVMTYKKAKICLVVLLIIICGIIVVCFGTRNDNSTAAENTEQQKKTSDIESTKSNEIVGQKPTINLADYPGADGTKLYYADEGKIIFADYYGLFVYDTQNHKFIQSVDLKPIGCNKTQGDDAREIMVKKDGSKVYLHVMSNKENMYEYSVDDNTFVQKKYDVDENDLYKGITNEECFFTTSTGKKKSYCIVNNYRSPLAELGYVCYDSETNYNLVFPLFVEDNFKNASYFNSSDIYDIMRAEINYEGKHYVCEDKEVLADIQNGYANAKKGYGMSACPFTYVMYLTRADGTVGMVIPAMDSCKACIMGDGWYEQDSLSMSIYDMINKGMFQVQ